MLWNLWIADKGCLLLGGNFKKIATFGTKCFVCYSWHVRHLGCTPLGGFNVFPKILFIKFVVAVFWNGDQRRLKVQKRLNMDFGLKRLKF